MAESVIYFVYIDSVQLKGKNKRKKERRKFPHHVVLVTFRVVYAVSKAVLWNPQGWGGPKRRVIGKRSPGGCAT